VVNKRSATISSGQVDKLETTMAQVHFSGTAPKENNNGLSVRARAIKLVSVPARGVRLSKLPGARGAR